MGNRVDVLKEKVINFIEGLKSDKKKLVVIVLIVLLCFVFIRGCSDSVGTKSDSKSGSGEIDLSMIDFSGDTNPEAGVGDLSQEGGQDTVTVYNQQLLDKQSELIQRYGRLPEGYIWDYDGTLLALGNKDLTAEEAMYMFLNGIRTLDFSSAQLYSKNSSVISRYDEFYSANKSADDRYEDNFYRNMYTLVLMSMQTHGVINIATFADNKQVFTVELEIIDLSDKDFWLSDMQEIYSNLYIYEQDEDDDSKSEQYIYDYILSHYKSDDVKKKVITVNITLEKDASLDTGWLVTIDRDIDNYCYYTDGVSVNKYIIYQYRNEGRTLIREQKKAEADDESSSEETVEEVIEEVVEEVVVSEENN